ncbi:MAG: hypothetical protein L6R28_12565 [Planctomycetes bacterium]|nr:hypothetical protein [Planctomycetota bacterium]
MRTHIFLLAALTASCAWCSEAHYDFETGIGPFWALELPLPPNTAGRKPEFLTPRLDDASGAACQSKSAFRIDYSRKPGVLMAIGAQVDVTGLRRLAFQVKSSAGGLSVVTMEDHDGAKFHHGFMLPANRWTEIELAPKDFKLSDDSPVKKRAVEPGRLKPGFAVADAAAIVRSPEGPATLWLDDITVTRKDPELVRKDWTVTKDTVLKETARIEGYWIIAEGVKVTVASPWLELPATVFVKKGATLRFEGGLVAVPSTYNYQFNLQVEDGARLETDGVKLAPAMPWGVGLNPGAAWHATKTEFPMHNLTATVQDRGELIFKDVTTPGEMVLWPGAKVNLSDCTDVLVWLHTETGARGRLDLPDGKQIARWRAPKALGLDVTMTTVKDVMWGLVPSEGNQLMVRDATLRTTGLLFKSKESATVRGLKNGLRYGAEPVLASKIALDLKGSSVQTWNIYGTEQANVKVEDCLFGEALTFAFSRMTIADSTCDGSGGYFGSKDHSTMDVRDSRIACRIVAHDDSKLTLVNCTIEGDIIAADRSTLTLINCKHTGGQRADPGAKLDVRDR